MKKSGREYSPNPSLINFMSESVKSLAELSERSSEEDSEEEILDNSDGEDYTQSSAAADVEADSRKQDQQKRRNLSGHEVRVAKETRDLFKSNVFKLQVDELLGEVRLEEKYIAEANKILRSLRTVLLESSSVAPVALKDAENLFQGSIPWPTHARPPTDIQYSFAYTPPTVVNVTGSWALHNSIKCPEGSGIDLFAEMPGHLFEAKDYLNYRYFHKRAFYLAAVGSIVAAHSKLGLLPRYQYVHNDPLRPVLRLDFSSTKLRKRLHVLLHLAIPDGTFAERKLAEERNCVRSTDAPTPYYNHSVLADQAHQSILNYIHEANSSCPAFGDACKLGALWLRQRGLLPVFGRFEWTTLMAALLQGGHESGKRVLLPGYSSYQLVKVMLLYLSSADLLQLEVGNPTIPLEVIDEDDDRPRLMFGNWNVFQYLSAENAKLLQYEAKLSVELLNDSVIDRFADLFLRFSGRLEVRADFAFELKLSDPFPDWSPDEWPSYQHFAVQKVSDILRRAWGPRVRTFVAKSQEENDEWALASNPPKQNFDIVMEVGAHLDASQAARRVTLSDENDVDFKPFWGEKTNTRRFQDGIIRDAVVWKNETPVTVVTEITQYILRKHVPGAQVKVAPNLECLVDDGRHFSSLITSLQNLSQSLQGLKESPLRIMSVYGASALCRYAALSGPQPFQCHTCDIADAAIEFESSGKWPRDGIAREKTKIAVLIRIAELVRKQVPSYNPLVGTDGAGVGFLLIQTPEGFHFRLFIATRYDSGLRSKVDHTRAIASLAQRHPTLSVVMRVLKKWFQEQLIASHVSEEAIELISCHPFLDSSPYPVPESPTTGFLRTMYFLSHWNWKKDPIIYDFAESQEEVKGCSLDLTLYQALMDSFVAQRRSDAALTQAPWVIESKLDPTGIYWTKSEPRSRVASLIASRITSLARKVARMEFLDVRSAFTPALQEFPVSLSVKSHLKPRILKNEVLSNPLRSMTEARNPALSFFHDIERAYSESLVLFSNFSIDEREKDHNLVIAGVWNPAVDSEPSKFKAGTSWPTKEAARGLVVLDKDAIVHEICRLGMGIVDSLAP